MRNRKTSIVVTHGNSTTELHASMIRYVESGEIPGMVYLVQHQDNLIVEAIGKRGRHGSPMSSDSIFRISSMTKPIIGVAVMTLCEDGILSLDDPVERYIPELADRRVLRGIDRALDDTEPARRSMTVRDLMTYHSGTGIVLAPPGTYPVQRAMDEMELGQGPPNPAVPPGPDEWIRRLGSLPLIHHPGERWMYGTSADILGVLIARVSGRSLETYLQERVFEPLEMVDTAFSVPPDKIDRFVTSYESDPLSGELTVYDPAIDGQWSRPPAFPSGAAGMVSTATDYLSFARMIMNRGQFGKHRIISDASTDLITSNHLRDEHGQDAKIILGEGKGWGFGLEVVLSGSQGKGSPGSYGWNGGLGTFWRNDQKGGLIAIFLTQTLWSSPEPPDVVNEFIHGAYQSIRVGSGHYHSENM